MNKVKGVLVLAFIFVLFSLCFGSDFAIKRKKNKWISSVDQQITDQRTTVNSCITL